jgi:hypothetical protein
MEADAAPARSVPQPEQNFAGAVKDWPHVGQNEWGRGTLGVDEGLFDSGNILSMDWFVASRIDPRNFALISSSLEVLISPPVD